MDAMVPTASEAPGVATKQTAYLLAVAGQDFRRPLQVLSIVLDRIMPALSNRDSRLVMVALSSLTNSLTDLATASKFGTAAPIIAPLEVGRVPKQASEGWRYHAEVNHLTLKAVDTEVRINATEGLLNTILRNLIGDSVQYTTSEGVLFGCRRRGCSLRNDVVYTGPGITAEETERMFKAFEHETLSNGLGLGVALAKQAAINLGASLRGRTMIDRGSCFSIAFPRTQVCAPLNGGDRPSKV